MGTRLISNNRPLRHGYLYRCEKCGTEFPFDSTGGAMSGWMIFKMRDYTTKECLMLCRHCNPPHGSLKYQTATIINGKTNWGPTDEQMLELIRERETKNADQSV